MNFLIFNLDGVKIGSETTIDSLLMDDFILGINDKFYNVHPPPIIDKPKVKEKFISKNHKKIFLLSTQNYIVVIIE